jgi:hypothetical protein
MSPSMARRLMMIAAHPVISNRAHVHVLPPAWGTLYELTKTDTTKLKNALKDGIISPDMKRRDIAALLPRGTAKPRRAGALIGARTPSSRIYFQISRVLSEGFDDLSVEDQADLIGMLEQTINELRERRNGKGA